MKNKIANFIMSLISILIIVVMCLFGIIIWQEVKNRNKNQVEVADFESTIFDTKDNKETLDTDIKAPNIVESTIDKLTGKNTENVDYSKVQVDKYLYNQLGEEAKTIYRALEANKENMKTGTHQIELGDVFSDLLNMENGQELLGKYYQSAIEAYTYDNPSVFYISPNKMFLNIEKTTNVFGSKYNVFINNGNQANYLVDEFQTREAIDNATNRIEEVKDYLLSARTGNTYNDIKNVHDYLVDNVEYDRSVSQPNIYDVYGALVNNVSVCEGYARAFKYIMDEMGIPCVLVIGEATNTQGQTENHAWNYVNINGSWYAVDATWDDPVILGGANLTSAYKYKYFLKGAATMADDHISSGQFTEGGMVFEYPELSMNDF